MTPRHVLLVFPVFQAMYPRPFGNFAEILITAGRQSDYTFSVQVIERQSLVTAMNYVGELMRARREFDACIVFDDDCFAPHDVIPRLLARCFDEGHSYVSALGLMRGYPFTTTAANFYPEGVSAVVSGGKVDHLSGFEWIDDFPNELTEVGFCGVPAAIMHRTVFEQIAPPWFGDADEDGQRVTHDVFFAKKLREAGIKVLVDGTIRCGHLIEAPIVTFENRAQARATVKG